MMKGKWMISNGCYIGHDITGIFSDVLKLEAFSKT